jgi:hypothetical protein
MSHIQTRKTFMIGVLAVLAVSLAVPSVFAATPGMTVMTTKHFYSGTETINVVGHVTPAPAKGTIATVKITGPHGGLAIATGTTKVVHGVFTVSFTTGGAAWKLSGTYTVTATVGTTTATSTFTYSA